MHNLPVYTVKERQPVNAERILVFGISTSFELGYVEPHWESVEYSWLIVDRDGEDTGCQVTYNGPDDVKEFVPDEPGEKMKLVMCVDGYELADDCRYALEADVYAMFPTEFQQPINSNVP